MKESSGGDKTQPVSSTGGNDFYKYDGANSKAELPVSTSRKATKRKATKSEDDAGDVIKHRRTWGLWPDSHKHIFFDALNEYGKDFDLIQAHFKSKLKKNAHQDIKNKDQIRHLYYRSWHKISPHIKFHTDMKKSTKELFGLINYGEIWKKIGGTIDDKLGAKLDELVQKGSVTFKHKGKNFRLKTPVCRALKRIHNSLDEEQIGPKPLPSKVVINLRPRETKDWCKVQKLAHNPHIKISVSLERKVSSLLMCLSTKWKSQQAKVIEASLPSDVSKPPPEEILVLFPEKNAKLKYPVITLAPTITSSQISLQSMKQDTVPAATKDSTEGKLKLKLKLAADRSSLVTESNGNRTVGDPNGCISQTQDCDKLATAESVGPMDHEAAYFDVIDDSEGDSSRSPGPPIEQDKESDVDLEDDEREEETDDKEVDGVEHKDIKLEKMDQNFSNLKSFSLTEGLTLDNCGDCSVGELYLMIAEEGESHFNLEYQWRCTTSEPEKKVPTQDGKPNAQNNCRGILSKLLKLSSANINKPGRGRQNSVSASASSPSVRNILSPASPVTSRASPSGARPEGAGNRSSRGAAKQLLKLDPSDKPTSPLAVPLEREVEFRKPLAPVIKPATLSTSFQQQIGQYFPKFSNRRGRQNRSRAKNQLIGRQIIQPIQPKQPLLPGTASVTTTAPQTFQRLLMPALGGAQVVSTNHTNPILIEAPLILRPANIIAGPVPITATTTSIADSVVVPNTTAATIANLQPYAKSPPQICIPSPGLSPVRRSPSPTIVLPSLPRSPSPTPSFSSFMDISFPDSVPVTPTKADQFLAMMDEGSLLHTPPRATSPTRAPTSPSRCLADSADMSLTSWALNFESPLKHNINHSVMHNEDSQASIISNSSEVDRQVTAMMNENSLDFTSTFRQLAKHVTSSDQELSQT